MEKMRTFCYSGGSKNKIKTKINKAGIFLNPDYPNMGASPDGITEKYCIEVKCPSKEKNLETYVVNGKVRPKFMYQVQLQNNIPFSALHL